MVISNRREVARKVDGRRRTLAAGLAVVALAALAGTRPAAAQDAAAVDPAHYTVVFENDQVRILRITYGPHEKSVMHSHPAGPVVFLSDIKGRFTLPDGSTQDLQVKAGTYTVTDASGAVVDAGKYIGVFEKRDGKWRYIRDTWNSDLPPPPAAGN